jgi:hypothetical protein
VKKWIGYRWLAEQYGIEPVQPFRIDSAIRGSRRTVHEAGVTHEVYGASMQPLDTLPAHLTFAFKHEGIHLEFLARLFRVVPPEVLQTWIATEPTGQYARRVGFFFEFLTGQVLAVPDATTGNYVTALDASQYMVASTVVNNSRWRVRNNMPGTAAYCPTVWRTPPVRFAEAYDYAAQLAKLEIEFGPESLQRSAVWLTIKESRASFAIEHEERHLDRVRRFAVVMEQRCGQGEDPLSEGELSQLQAQILGPRATRYGLRRSPVFVGEINNLTEVVHYIAPHWDDAPELLQGLRDFSMRTAAVPALVRAAVLSFGFVYIHPMADGNGRISRFLINDELRRQGAIPAPFILPVSATIISTATHRVGYEQVLERFSKPLMQKYADRWHFRETQVAEDGIRYNLVFTDYADALFAWRYPDMTDHVAYLAEVIQKTLEQEMREEAGFLRSLYLAREQVKQIIEGPDSDIDRIIRSVRENSGQVSNKLVKEFALLGEASIADAVVAAIQRAFVTPS